MFSQNVLRMHPPILLKKPGEVGDLAVADPQRDFLNGPVVSAAQQFFGAIEPEAAQVMVGRNTVRILDVAVEGALAQPDVFGDLGVGQVRVAELFA